MSKRSNAADTSGEWDVGHRVLNIFTSSRGLESSKLSPFLTIQNRSGEALDQEEEEQAHDVTSLSSYAEQKARKNRQDVVVIRIKSRARELTGVV